MRPIFGGPNIAVPTPMETVLMRHASAGQSDNDVLSQYSNQTIVIRETACVLDTNDDPEDLTNDPNVDGRPPTPHGDDTVPAEEGATPYRDAVDPGAVEADAIADRGGEAPNGHHAGAGDGLGARMY